MKTCVGRAAIAATAIGLVLACAGVAAASTLRSPQLATCASDKTYGEYTFGPWRVEGCSKSVTPIGAETSRRVYSGKVEVNGMLVEGTTDLTAAATPAGILVSGRVIRSGSTTNLVLDPLIGGARRRIVLHTGSVDLISASQNQAQTEVGGTAPGGVNQQPTRPGARRAAVILGQGTVDIPVTGTPSLLGMRIRAQINDATVRKGGDLVPGSIEFKVSLSLGTNASDLLKDWTADVTVETTDGSGMKVTALKFKVPDIEIAGIGGFKDLHVTYSADDDEWAGGVDLDLGDLFPTLEFEMAVRASDGVPTYIRAKVDNLNIPIGPTGIVLQSAEAAFQLDPLTLSAGLSATAGPQVAGAALITLTGDLEVRLEPTFRLEATGSARILPVGSSSQLATGTVTIIFDAAGFLSIAGDAHYGVSAFGIGISADIGGSGAYATSGNRFNIEAHATGSLELGDLGSFPIAEVAAVVSDVGWGACGRLNFLLSGGVGQNWGRGIKILLGCDLSPFSDPISGRRTARGVGGPTRTLHDAPPSRTFDVAPGTKVLAVEVRADAPEPRVRLRGPDGGVVVTSVPLGRREIGTTAAVIAQSGAATQYLAVSRPASGRWTLEWDPDGPQVTGLRTARDVDPVRASVSVLRRRADRPGRRSIRVTDVAGVQPGEQVVLGIRTPSGVEPLGDPGAGVLDMAFEETGAGPRDVVATVLRDGVPIPQRSAVVGHYEASLPGPPTTLTVLRRGGRLTLTARTTAAAEPPDAWQFVLRRGVGRFKVIRARAGRSATVVIPRRLRDVHVAIRPVLGGRVLRGAAVTATIPAETRRAVTRRLRLRRVRDRG